MDETLNQWFTREILVHELALMRFFRRAWPDRWEIDDLCQETYIRVYESAAKGLPSAPQAFLYATAKHLMSDRVRRGKIVSIEMKGDLDALNVLIEEISPETRLNARQELWRLAQAFGLLSPISQDVVWMLKVDEMPQKEVAQRLGITPKAVQNRLARSIRVLEDAYFGDQELDGPNRGSENFGGESEHG